MPDYARLRVLKAYNAKCAWCSATGDLEIDHVFADGWRHRQALGKQRLEEWLCQQYRANGFWPHAYQLLCQVHHRLKTDLERKAAMPARQGATAVKIVLDDAMAAEVKARANDPRFQGNQSNVIAHALTQFFEQEATQVAVLGFQHQLGPPAAIGGKFTVIASKSSQRLSAS